MTGMRVDGEAGDTRRANATGAADSAGAASAAGAADGAGAASPAAQSIETDDPRPEGFRRVRAALAALGHPHTPVWLEVAARTSQEAADALGVTVAQIAKSVIFRRPAAGDRPEAAVLVVTSGDKRVDEKRVAALVCGEGGKLARADAEFVKARTGFSIGGVAPLAHREPPVVLIDRELFRFEEIWAAAGHPNGVFRLTPADLPRLTGGAPVADVVQPAPA